MSTTAATVSKGGAWLVEETDPASVFTPEKLSEEHGLMAQTANDFVVNEVLPNLDRLEQKDWGLARALVKKCGDLGLFGINVPEDYGGVDLGKIAALVVSENIARSASFGATYGAQANLCILPIFLFGTEQQRQKYLPTLLSGDAVGAYALSESGAGSDALNAKARATKQADGSWVLNGEKMWITNGGFADVIIVFAKVDGEHFTAFIVEKGFPGVSAGKEEHKMGLHGSSTTPIILQDAKVPAENLLGEIGKGHKVALNTLNYGRFKLGAMCVGGAKAVIAEAITYAATRRQFGQPIAGFGAIKHKIGEMTARTYALDSLMYRTGGLIDLLIESIPHDHKDGAVSLKALEEYVVESSIAKVFGSEVIDYVLDENLQIHGGNGFVKDYPAEGHYRDARVNRIFEGTNEINRMLIPGMLIRRALKGEVPIIQAAKALQDELLNPTPPALSMDEGVLAAELKMVAAFKKVALMMLGTAMQTYGQKLSDEQEVLSYAADIMIDTYAAESAVLRAIAASSDGAANAELHRDAAAAFVHEAAARIEGAARNGLAATVEGDMLRTLLAALRRVLKWTPANTVALRRRLSDATLAKGGYIFG